MPPVGRPLAAALAALALAACAATPQTEALLADRGTLPASAEVEGVPFVPQEELWCGPAAMAMALSWSGLPTTQEQAAAQVYTPGREGTLAVDMTTAARRNGRLAVEIGTVQDLLAEIAAGHPVVVFQNLALEIYPQWHYAVAFGYDLEQGTILLHSGLDKRRETKLGTFELTWGRADNWALVVLPPDRLPATVPEERVAAAAAAIERAGRADAAAISYRAILRRWPGNATALVGLGNLAYARGDLDQAAEHYRRATEAAPRLGAAWNNLAVALSEQGERDAALDAVRRAIATGEGDQEEFRRTLAEIEAAP